MVGVRHRLGGLGLALISLLGLGVISGVSAPAQSGDTALKLLYAFTGGSDGELPLSGLVMDSKGNLYGAAYSGGADGWGTIFKISTTGVQSVLYTFTGNADGGSPEGPLVLDSQGNLYGAAQYGGSFTCNSFFGCGTVFKISPTGTETTLYSFTGVGGDGENPAAGVILDSAGNIYGTTPNGGSGTYGMVYKISPSGQETVLYGFQGAADGGLPEAGLAIDSSGNLYGTTAFYGLCSECGTVFKISTAGKFTTLHPFQGNVTDGGFPKGNLLLDSQGNIYGTTSSGGKNNSGTVFKISPSGTETVLHSFGATDSGDGQNPSGTLVIDSSGNLYGTTQNGGTSSGGYQLGVAFEVTAAGNETVLYGFPMAASGCPSYPNGAYPVGGLISDTKGNLYGTAYEGGAASACEGYGTVFQLLPPSAKPVAQTSTAKLQFGSIPFGNTETLSLTVTNVGGGTLTFTTSINAQSYTISSSTCGSGVVAGASCTLKLKFAPITVGTHNAALYLYTNASTTVEVKLNGVAEGIAPGTSLLSFTSIPSGSSEVMPLTVTNYGVAGTVTLSTSISGTAFTVLTTAQNTCLAGIKSGQSCTLPIQFGPASVSTHINTLTITPSAGTAYPTVELKGTITAQ